MAKHKRGLTKAKARKILKDKEVKGHPLTPKQRKFFGARASGSPIRGLKRSRRGKR